MKMEDSAGGQRNGAADGEIVGASMLALGAIEGGTMITTASGNMGGGHTRPGTNRRLRRQPQSRSWRCGFARSQCRKEFLTLGDNGRRRRRGGGRTALSVATTLATGPRLATIKRDGATNSWVLGVRSDGGESFRVGHVQPERLGHNHARSPKQMLSEEVHPVASLVIARRVETVGAVGRGIAQKHVIHVAIVELPLGGGQCCNAVVEDARELGGEKDATNGSCGRGG